MERLHSAMPRHRLCLQMSPLHRYLGLLWVGTIFSIHQFDDKTTWEMVAELNDWNVTEKAAFLATSLEGSTANVFGGMDSLKRHSYCSLVTALETRFGVTGQQELSHVKLRNRQRRKGEPVCLNWQRTQNVYLILHIGKFHQACKTSTPKNSLSML